MMFPGTAPLIYVVNKQQKETQEMQGLGYIIDKANNEKILLLVRQKQYSRGLRKRESGLDGIHFKDEENYLNDEGKERLKVLKAGVTIYI